METIVVTRHEALVKYLREIGLIDENTPVIAHATPEQVRGKHVIGVLPLHLAALVAQVTEVPLRVPPELRGQELTLEQIRKYAGEPQTYQVWTPQQMKAAAEFMYHGGANADTAYSLGTPEFRAEILKRTE